MIYYIMLRLDGKVYSLPSDSNIPYSTREEAKEAALAMGYLPDEIEILEWKVD